MARITMAPSAESMTIKASRDNDSASVMEPLPPAAPSQNVAFAVNYDLAMVDQFVAEARVKRRRNGTTSPDDNNTNNAEASSKAAFNLENDAPNLQEDGEQQNEVVPAATATTNVAAAAAATPVPDPPNMNTPPPIQQERKVEIQTPTPANRRVSARDRGKRTPMARSRTRYDMEKVPVVKRNTNFLNAFPRWWLKDDNKINEEEKQQMERRRSSRLTGGATSATTTEETDTTTPEEESPLSETPFAEDSSVLWIPSKRAEWEDTISEMTSVCTSAAMRRHDFSKPFVAPLSRDYIRDRVDIDDPLLGYQLRHKDGGWLQGFVMFTNFTTWTHGFHWDSKHPMSAFAPPPEAKDNSTSNAPSSKYIDLDGSLAEELEAQPRSGDPRGEGIVFRSLAEIGLLGGLGCGEYLLRMALDTIRQHKQYKYVVLQATDQSKTFYERFGFVRVGAICRYGIPQEGQSEEDLPVQGYRHWTHANESERSLQKHGGPSYMMCLKLPQEEEIKLPQEEEKEQEASAAGAPAAPESPTTSFVDVMLSALKVNAKPRVELLGAASTPGPKFAARRSMSMPIEISASYNRSSGAGSPRGGGGGSNKKKLMRRGSDVKQLPSSSRATASSLASSSTGSTTKNSRAGKLPKQAPKRSLSTDSLTTKDQRSAKRRKIANSPATKKPAAVSRIPPPPKNGRPLSYMEKQYHSVWLAVPPSSSSASIAARRPPPKRRGPSRGVSATSSKKAARTSKRLIPRRKSTSAKKKKSPPPMSRKSGGAVPKNYTAIGDDGRMFYSVRGPDGKFKRVAVNGQEAPPRRKSPPASAPARKPPPAPAVAVEKNRAKPVFRSSPIRPETPYVSLTADSGKRRIPKAIDKNLLKKQKVRSYPRHVAHFYNRVVKLKNSKEPHEYFFVLQYDEKNNLMQIVPMVARGKLAGKREGRPRYQAVVEDTDANFRIVSTEDYEVVRSAMVMKTPIVWQEAWDVESKDDAKFETR